MINRSEPLRKFYQANIKSNGYLNRANCAEAELYKIKIQKAQCLTEIENLKNQLCELKKDFEGKQKQIQELTTNFEDLKQEKQPILDKMFQELYGGAVTRFHELLQKKIDLEESLKSVKEKSDALETENFDLKTEIETLRNKTLEIDKWRKHHKKVYRNHLIDFHLSGDESLNQEETRVLEKMWKMKEGIKEPGEKQSQEQQTPQKIIQQQAPMKPIDIDKLSEVLESELYLSGIQCLCGKSKREGKHTCRSCYKLIDIKRHAEGLSMIEARIKYFEDLLRKSNGNSNGFSET